MTKEIEIIKKDTTEFYSQIVNSKNIEGVIEKIVQIYNLSDIKLQTVLDLNNMYYALKSYRSNVTEGNTTTIGEFTQIIQGNKDEIIGQTQDNLLEIENLWSAYMYVRDKDISEREILSCHRILGTEILKNNLSQNRGKYKRNNNFVTFIYDNQRYIKKFRQKEVVKQDIKNLVGLLGKFTPKNDAEIFAKYLIIHTEIISIHPFEDGNGRISRLLAETYLEQNGYHPYTPFSDGAKREYQDAMGVFSVKSQNSLVEAYEYLTEFILNEYLDNIKNFKMSLEKFESVQKNEIINNK